MRLIIIISAILLFVPAIYGQEINFKDTINNYNKIRIKNNLTGTEVLGVWGVANMVSGGVGAIVSTGETKYFFGANAAWGAVNTGIAYALYTRAVKQAAQNTDFNTKYRYYQDDKKFFFYKSIVDAAVIGVGLGLMSSGQSSNTINAPLTGFGKSCIMQGSGMLIFDYVMAFVHNGNSFRWHTIMDELRFTGMGLNYVPHF